MQRYDFLKQQIEACEAPDRGADRPPDAARRFRGRQSVRGRRAWRRIVRRRLHEMMGVDLTAIPAIGTGPVLTIASEIGTDFSAFPFRPALLLLAGGGARDRISGGKPLPGRAPKVVNPVGQALRMAAMAARRSQTFIGAKHRARLARKDAAVVITATARELACLIYLMVTRDMPVSASRRRYQP